VIAVRAMSDEPLDRFWQAQPVDGVVYVSLTGMISRDRPLESCCPPYEAWVCENDLIELLGACADDERCEAVVLMIDSPGGQSEAMPSIIRAVDDLAAAKPVLSHIDHAAYSAAYWIACRTHQIWMASPMAGVGSIGTLISIIDVSEHLERHGIKKIYITDASEKTLFADGVRVDQAAVDKAMRIIEPCSAMFRADVATGRNVSEQMIIELDGAVVMAEEAIRIGLADAIVARADLHTTVMASLEVIGTKEHSAA